MIMKRLILTMIFSFSSCFVFAQPVWLGTACPPPEEINNVANGASGTYFLTATNNIQYMVNVNFSKTANALNSDSFLNVIIPTNNSQASEDGAPGYCSYSNLNSGHPASATAQILTVDKFASEFPFSGSWNDSKSGSYTYYTCSGGHDVTKCPYMLIYKN